MTVDRKIINDLDFQNAQKVKNAVDGTAPQDYVTKTQLDAVVSGLEWKQAVDLATDAALPANTYSNGASGVGATLTGVAFGALTVDGSTVTVGQRILVKNEVSDSHNGIYVVTTVGAIATLYVLTRATDYDQTSEIQAGTATFVTTGSSNVDTAWVMTATGTITVGTDSITFAQFGGGGGGPASSLTPGRNIDGQFFDGTADITVIAPGTHAATSKNPPIDADEFPIVDTAASNVLKKVTFTNLKAYLKTYFDGIYAATTGSAPIGTPELIYRYTVTGSDKASIDTGADTADAGSNDWTGGDLLEVFFTHRTDEAGATVNPSMILNNDTGTKYVRQVVRGNNASATAGADAGSTSWLWNGHGSGGRAAMPSSLELVIPDYAGTTFEKAGRMSVLTPDTAAGNEFTEHWAVGFLSTSAVSRLKVAAAGAAKFKVGTQLLIYKRRAS